MWSHSARYLTLPSPPSKDTERDWNYKDAEEEEEKLSLNEEKVLFEPQPQVFKMIGSPKIIFTLTHSPLSPFRVIIVVSLIDSPNKFYSD
jgi:hypothetical protein